MVISKNILSLKDFFWMIGILSFPFYIFGSGGFQISTVFLLIAALSEINKLNFKDEAYITVKKKIISLFLFVIYAILITLTWFVITQDISILVFPLIYIFDFFILFALCLRLFKDVDFIKFFAYLIVLSTIIQFIISIILVSDSFRGTLFFNNPNQLGYFSLLSAAIITVLVKKKYINTIYYVIAMLCCIWLAQLSLSKSAIMSEILLLAYGLVSNVRAQIIVIVLIIGTIFIVSDVSFLLDRFDIVYSRLEGIGSESDDNAEGRGYDRIWLQPQMLLLGGAEGAVYRWDTFLVGYEMHSTWGTILFSYGIFGLICWLYFLSKVAFSNRLVTFIPLLSVFAYGITHNGLRFIYFWFFMAILVFVSIQRKTEVLEE